MAGMQDPREEEVTPLEPDFTLTSDSGEVGAIYEATLVSLLEVFYADLQELPPEEVYNTIEDRANQLFDDIMATIAMMLPAVVLLGVADALESIFKSIESEGYGFNDKQKKEIASYLERKAKLHNEYSLTDQELTAKAIVDEVRNDLRTSSFFVMNRLKKEPNTKIKSGNIVRRAVNRVKKMAVYGVMSSYHFGKEVYYSLVYTPETGYDWITKRDFKVCDFCKFFESISPIPERLLPPCPYHLWCRCTYEPSEVFYFKKGFSDFLTKLWG